jgi:hypothetical protein
MDYWKGKIIEVRKERREDFQYLYRGINEFQNG